ncbi:hypothetical protein Pen02_46370 [Plantactinospora endophytica]|uniref:Uncharacterized protein n=1 Tax=Plantactinospora endophytica TaxID=673535 RepID=A0ABQ4E5U9_9ACTN|nr:hypothetical protein Pen02_46370 [Plantactinospora endophytica]
MTRATSGDLAVSAGIPYSGISVKLAWPTFYPETAGHRAPARSKVPLDGRPAQGETVACQVVSARPIPPRAPCAGASLVVAEPPIPPGQPIAPTAVRGVTSLEQ